jgi:ACS family hexuronate transporter-like MFS transporter
MLAVSLISYIDRNALALLAPSILAECRLSAEQYGWIISAFSIAYMAANPLWGRWLDRWGVRRGMSLAVAFWSAASSAHAALAGFWGFAAARAALGFGEGATFPGGLRTVVQTLPDRLRARGVALAFSGGSLGAVLTPLIITPIYRLAGWRGAFVFTGLIGVLWLVLWTFVSRRRDLDHPARSSSAAPAPPVRWTDARLWSYIVAYAFGCLPLAFVIYQVPLYMSRALGKSQLELGAVLWIPPLGWECGYFLWGWLTDRFRGPSDPLAIHRRLMLAGALLCLPLAAGARLSSFPLLLALLFWAMFVAGGTIIVAVGYATEVFSTAHAGLLAGIGAGSWSAFVALSMPWFGRLADRQAWDAAFAAAAVIACLGYLAWLAVNRPTPRGQSPLSPALIATESRSR